MWGPDDPGLTSAGQLSLDVMNGKLPAIVPVTFSVVDARDVAAALIMVTFKAKPGERDLVAGCHIHMKDLVFMIGSLCQCQNANEDHTTATIVLHRSFSGSLWQAYRQALLLSLASIRLMARQYDRTHFSRERYDKILGLQDL